MSKHLEYAGVSPDVKRAMSASLAESVRTRIGRGIDVKDRQAVPLSPSYAKAKLSRGLAPRRDWKWTGRTIAALAPLDSPSGEPTVGFTNDRARNIAARQNSGKSEMFGMSPSDRDAASQPLTTLTINDLLK